MPLRHGRVPAILCALALSLSPTLTAPGAGQSNGKGASQVVAQTGASYVLSGTDTLRRDNQLVLYTPDYYRKNPPNASGVDVYVLGGKVAEVRDRAGAVYIEKKADPGPVNVGKEGYVLSGNGAARKWLIGNLRAGEAVNLTAAPQSPTGGEVPPAAELPCFPGAYYRKAV